MGTTDPRTLLATLTRLEQSRTAPPPGAKRHYRRFVVRGEAELRPLEGARLDQRPVAVQLRDVGLGGLGFVASEPLEHDSLWCAHFGQQGLTIGTQTIKICHCRRVEDGLYLIGGQFCIDTGLLYVLGVSATDIHNKLFPDGEAVSSFLPPGEVA
jgi:hypothetical protein